MTRTFTQFAFSSSVKATQARYGAREHGERLEQKDQANDHLSADIIAFIEGADSFFIGTANSEGWPHVQHRGGPVGFLKVLDGRTLAFADFSGNKNYITAGNLAENNRTVLFLIDYERRRRLKIWGHAAVIDDDESLTRRVSDPDYPAVVERVIRIDVKAWDLNCRQHLPKLVRARS